MEFYTEMKADLGIKHDSEKLRFSLLPLEEVEEVVKVFEHGARKYKPENWKYVKPMTRYWDAAIRHLVAWKCGTRLDSASGLSVLAHAIASILFLMWHEKNDDNERE